MDAQNRPKNAKHDGVKNKKFEKKEIKHDPQAESARAVFGREKQE